MGVLRDTLRCNHLLNSWLLEASGHFLGEVAPLAHSTTAWCLSPHPGLYHSSLTYSLGSHVPTCQHHFTWHDWRTAYPTGSTGTKLLYTPELNRAVALHPSFPSTCFSKQGFHQVLCSHLHLCSCPKTNEPSIVLDSSVAASCYRVTLPDYFEAGASSPHTSSLFLSQVWRALQFMRKYYARSHTTSTMALLFMKESFICPALR